jgi:hypothetical protein
VPRKLRECAARAGLTSGFVGLKMDPPMSGQAVRNLAKVAGIQPKVDTAGNYQFTSVQVRMLKAFRRARAARRRSQKESA